MPCVNFLEMMVSCIICCFCVGVRALDGKMTDLLERDAFAAKHHINDIYSCSWGPEDDGKTVDGPHTLAKVRVACYQLSLYLG